MRDKQGLFVLGGIAALLLLLIKSAPAADTSGTFIGQPIVYNTPAGTRVGPWYQRGCRNC